MELSFVLLFHVTRESKTNLSIIIDFFPPRQGVDIELTA